MKKILLSMSAAAALLTAATADAGQLYMTNLSGQNETPPNASTFGGTSFFVLDTRLTPAGQTTGAVWAYHTIDNTLRSAQIETVGANPYVLQGAANPLGPEELIILSPTTVIPALNNKGVAINFLTTAFPNGVIRGTYVPYSFAVSTTNRIESSISTMLNVSAGVTRDLDGIMVSIARATPAQQAVTFQDLSARKLYAQSVGSLDNQAALQDAIFAHASELGSRGPNFTFFAKAGDTFAKRDTTLDQEGSKVARPYFVGGIDYNFSQTLVAGIAVGYADGKDKFRDGLGTTDVSTVDGLIYINSANDKVVLQAVAGYAQNHFETSRNLLSLSRTAVSIHDGSGWSVAAKASVPYHLDANTILSPYLLIDTQRTTVDGYTETNANAVGLIVPTHKDKDFAVELGGMLQAPFGDLLLGRFEAGFRQSLDGGGKNVLVSLIGSPVKFSTNFLGRSPNAGRVGMAFSTEFGGNLYAEVGYRGYISGRMTSHTFEARVTLRM